LKRESATKQEPENAGNTAASSGSSDGTGNGQNVSRYPNGICEERSSVACAKNDKSPILEEEYKHNQRNDPLTR